MTNNINTVLILDLFCFLFTSRMQPILNIMWDLMFSWLWVWWLLSSSTWCYAMCPYLRGGRVSYARKWGYKYGEIRKGKRTVSRQAIMRRWPLGQSTYLKRKGVRRNVMRKRSQFLSPFSSTRLVTYSQTTQYHIPKDNNLNIKYCSETRIYQY